MFESILVDDEYPARLRLRKLLANYGQEVKILKETDRGKEAINQIEVLRPQLLFLDIHLPDMTGFDVLDELTYLPMVIFSTAYEKYAVQAFERYSVDYLVKPYTAERFAKTIDKLLKFGNSHSLGNYQDLGKHYLEAMKVNQAVALPIKVGNKIILVPYEEISHFQAADKYTTVFTRIGAKYISERSLSRLEQELPSSFLRVHRSWIIHKSAIGEIHKYFKGQLILILNDKAKSRVRTGAKYSVAVKKALGLQ